MKNKILYLEDNKFCLNTFSSHYDSSYHVYTTDNVDQAHEILYNEEIKVVISDQHMPDIKGIDFIKEVNRFYPEIACVITSGYTDKDILFKAINEVNIIGFIEKPWNLNEFNHILKRAINKYDSEQERIKINTQLELALEKAQESDRLKTEFLGSISHEVRTPINCITGFSDLLKINKQLDTKTKGYLDVITNSANRLNSLVDDMLTASRLHAGLVDINQHDVYINELLDELHRQYLPKIHKKGNIDFVVKRLKGYRNITITTDKKKLYSIFKQLIKNAIKFTNKGSIEFGIYNNEEGIFYVKDTGTGISENDQVDMFDFFRQGKQKFLSAQIEGIGIGLSIVKGLINLLKGDIWVESELNIGTTFYFRLPLEKKLIPESVLRERPNMSYSNII